MWAFGVVCWEIASRGEDPYGGNQNLPKTLESIDVGGRRLVWPSGTPPLLQEIGVKAWTLEPSERPRFAEVNQQLLEWVGAQADQVQDIGAMHGARFSTEIYTRGCHWFPRLCSA
jgi:hypothetical protein